MATTDTTPAYEIRSTPTAGNGLFALHDLPASALVIQDKSPFVAVLDSPTLTKACSWCFVFADEASEDEHLKLSACTGCKIARYCGKVSVPRHLSIVHCASYQLDRVAFAGFEWPHPALIYMACHLCSD